jgi:hypothetical protein
MSGQTRYIEDMHMLLQILDDIKDQLKRIANSLEDQTMIERERHL